MNLAPQLADLLALLARQPLTPAGIDLRATHPLAQRLGRHTQITSYLRDRTPRLKNESDTAIHQLNRILPRSWHEAEFLSGGQKPSYQGLRQTRPASVGVTTAVKVAGPPRR